MGTVRTVGADVDRAWIGKSVATATASSGIGGGLPIGGYAERALAKALSLIETPEISPTKAVAVVHDGRTALGIFERAAVQAGDHVPITAAGGGLGTLLIQLARRAGATVIAAVRGAAKLKLAGRLGADAVIDYSQNDWTEQVPAATGGSGPRLMFDGAGGALGSAAPAVTADGGRFIGYGAAGGDFATTTGVDRNVEVVTLFDLQADAAEQYRRGVHVQADRAHAAIETRTAIGRTVLTV